MDSQGQYLISAPRYQGHTPKRAQNSLILDRMRQQVSDIPGAFSRSLRPMRRMYTVNPTITPALPPPSVLLPSAEQIAKPDFSYLPVPVITQDQAQQVTPYGSQLDKILALLTQLNESAQKTVITPRKYITRSRRIAVVAAGVVQIASGDPDRHVLIITQGTTITITVGIAPDLTGSSGWQLTATAPAVVTQQSHGVLVSFPWFAFLSGPGNVLVNEAYLVPTE